MDWAFTIALVVAVITLVGAKAFAWQMTGLLLVGLFPVFFFAPLPPLYVWHWVATRFDWPRWARLATLPFAIALFALVLLWIERLFGAGREW